MKDYHLKEPDGYCDLDIVTDINLKRPAKMETTPERAMMKVQTPSTRLMSESPKERMPKWRMLEAVATKPF